MNIVEATIIAAGTHRKIRHPDMGTRWFDAYGVYLKEFPPRPSGSVGYAVLGVNDILRDDYEVYEVEE